MRVSSKTMAVAGVGLAIAGLVALMAFGLANKTPVTGKSGYTRVDKPAPQFTLPLFDGGQLNLSEHVGRPIVINFWASWCPPCAEEAPLLEAAWRSNRDDVLFVGVDIQDDERAGRAYLEEFDITYPNGLDEGGEITVMYGVIGLPVTFFVNADGIVERRWVGALQQRPLNNWVRSLVEGTGLPGQSDGENLDSYVEFD